MRKSFSQWENYAQCPRRWKHGYIDKLPRTSAGPAAQRGIAIHNSIEGYIQGEHDQPPTAYHRDILDYFRNRSNGELVTEYAVEFDSGWNRTGPKESQSGWVGVFDAVLIRPGELEIGEWKSGKPKDSHADQRRMYTLMGFMAWPVDKVVATTYYFDGTSEPNRLTATRKAIPILKKQWDDRGKQMETDTFWPPRPGYHCRWCDFSKSKGGPCPFSG